MVVELVKNEKIAQFHVGYMSYPDLHQNKEFKDQVEKYELFIWQTNNDFYHIRVEEIQQ